MTHFSPKREGIEDMKPDISLVSGGYTGVHPSTRVSFSEAKGSTLQFQGKESFLRRKEQTTLLVRIGGTGCSRGVRYLH